MNVLTDAANATPAVPTDVPRNDATQMVANGPAYLCGRPLGEILRTTAGLTEEKLQEALALQAE
jgi:general secretion pathway protein E